MIAMFCKEAAVLLRVIDERCVSENRNNIRAPCAAVCAEEWWCRANIFRAVLAHTGSQLAHGIRITLIKSTYVCVSNILFQHAQLEGRNDYDLCKLRFARK